MKKVAALFIVLLQFSFALQAQDLKNPGLPPSHSPFNHYSGTFSPLQDDVLYPLDPTGGTLCGQKNLVWKWDTIVCYDTSGAIQRYRAIFETNGHLVMRIGELWQGGAWTPDSRYMYNYDMNWNPITITMDNWLGIAWENNMRFNFTYDAYGKLMIKMVEQWLGSNWVYSWQYNYSYDGNGNVKNILIKQWDGTAWLEYAKDTYTCDGSGHVLTELRELLSGTWVPSYRWTNTYNSQGKQLTGLNEIWQNNAWMNVWRFTNTYDINGNLQSEVDQTWQSYTWVNYWRYIKTYDPSGNLLNDLWMVWENNFWINHFQYTHTYDMTGNSVSGKCEMWTGNGWSEGIDHLWLYAGQSAVFRLTYLYRYVALFSLYNSGSARVTADDALIQIYPVPANDKLIIDDLSATRAQKTVSLRDMQGKLLIRLDMIDKATVLDISSLAGGIYFVSIDNGAIPVVRKVIKL